MHTAIKIISFLIIVALLNIAIGYFQKGDSYDDTIVYIAEEEEIFLDEIAEDVATSTINPPELEEIIEEPELEVVVQEEVEEIQEIVKPPIKEEPVLAEVIESPPPAIEALENEASDKISFGEINLLTREALVNILCATKGPHQYITPISGTGTIIDERGIILTNAHIAQFWLFENFPVDNFVNCTIRTGSPARAMYKAELLYISPKWIEENSDAITTENPMGTGQHDFALLLITEAVYNQSLPETFPYIPVETNENSVEREDPLLIGGYPAGFLGGRTIEQDLYASSAITESMELYTFDETGTLDLVSLGGTVVAQQGASGGPAVNEYGNMIGLISTASDGEFTSERDLRAITLEHIERSLVENNQTTLEELLSGDIEAKAEAFNETTATTLLQILLRAFSL